MIWRLAKDHDLLKFWPYGRLKGPKIENENSKKYRTFVILIFVHERKLPDDMNKSNEPRFQRVFKMELFGQ